MANDAGRLLELQGLTLQQRLAIINAWLQEDFDALELEPLAPVKCYQSNLWDVLSALRGPDMLDTNGGTVPDDQLKWDTTAIIRQKALPASSRLCMVNTSSSVVVREACNRAYFSSWHFASHIEAAAMALGILAPLEAPDGQ